MNILLASDNDAYHNYLGLFLAQKGHTTESVMTEGSMIWSLHQKRPDHIILGHFSANRPALVVLRDLRKDPVGKDIPVLVHVSGAVLTSREIIVLKTFKAHYFPQPDFEPLHEYLLAHS